MKPLIGLTSYAEEVSWGHWTLPAALVPLSYVRSVVPRYAAAERRAGGPSAAAADMAAAAENA